MNRAEFTDKISQLLRMMIDFGERPLIDFVKRSAEEQRRLFDIHLSKCDGVVKVSRHQVGKAMDIYFLSEDGHDLVDSNYGLPYWHSRWDELGGNPMLTWDKNHFEC